MPDSKSTSLDAYVRVVFYIPKRYVRVLKYFAYRKHIPIGKVVRNIVINWCTVPMEKTNAYPGLYNMLHWNPGKLDDTRRRKGKLQSDC